MPSSRVPSRPQPAVPGVHPRHRAPGPVAGTVTKILDPVLVPLGFAPGQGGFDGERGQVIFCRGVIGSPDGGCVDLVLDLEAGADWRISDVRYWGFPSDRWHLGFEHGASLADQLAGLARALPGQLGSEATR